MSFLIIIFAALNVLLFFQFDHIEAKNKLKLSVYYGSFDPSCKRFIKESLEPTFENLHDYLDIEVIPFGNAKMTKKNGNYEFKCKFGPRECSINKVQSCVWDMYPQMQALKFIKCNAMQPDPITDKVVQMCAKNTAIRYEEIRKCHDSRGNELLAANGMKSEKIGYHFIPAILFNDTYDPKMSNLGQTNLFVYVCTLLESPPKACASALYK